MSIYGTASVFKVEVSHGKFVEVIEQVVPAWVDFECDYLPPPRAVPEEDGYVHPRAVLFVHEDSKKSGEGFGSQQYHDPPPLLMLSGEEYERATWREVMRKLQDALNGSFR